MTEKEYQALKIGDEVYHNSFQPGKPRSSMKLRVVGQNSIYKRLQIIENPFAGDFNCPEGEFPDEIGQVMNSCSYACIHSLVSKPESPTRRLSRLELLDDS